MPVIIKKKTGGASKPKGRGRTTTAKPTTAQQRSKVAKEVAKKRGQGARTKSETKTNGNAPKRGTRDYQPENGGETLRIPGHISQETLDKHEEVLRDKGGARAEADAAHKEAVKELRDAIEDAIADDIPLSFIIAQTGMARQTTYKMLGRSSLKPSTNGGKRAKKSTKTTESSKSGAKKPAAKKTTTTKRGGSRVRVKK